MTSPLREDAAIGSWFESLPKPLPEYDIAISDLKSLLYNAPPRVITVDGFDGTGKSNLARFLAWRFKANLVETDLFISNRKVTRSYQDIAYNYRPLKKIAKEVIQRRKHLVIEGVAMLQLLERLEVKSDYLIYCDGSEDDKYDRDFGLSQLLKDYQAHYNPKASANHVFELNKHFN